MGKYIRWQGLVAFVAIVALAAALSLLFLDTWIRLGVEAAAGRAVGAEVNVAGASHSFGPFGVTLEQLEVTDAARPTHNRVQVGTLSAEVAVLPLLSGKVVIDRLIVTGVDFDTQRQRPGEVYLEDVAAREAGGSWLPEGIETPSVEAVMANAPLRTPQAAQQVQAAYERHRDVLTRRYEALPSEATLEDYRARIEALRQADYRDPAVLAGAREEFEQLLSDLREERETIQAFQEASGTAREDISVRLAELRAAPGEDYDLVRGVIAGDAAAMGELTEAVFGARVRAWSGRLFAAYEVVAPMLARRQAEQDQGERAEGRWITFADTQPLPAFLVREADVSIRWRGQRLASQWRNITTDHARLGSPTTFILDSADSPLWRSLRVDGRFSIEATGISASQDWDLSGMALSDIPLSGADALDSRLQRALLSSTGSLSVANSIMEGQGSLDLSEMAISAEGGNELTRLIAASLQELDTLAINADISGAVRAPRLSLQSDLDQRFAQALANNLGAEERRKLDEVQRRLAAMAEPTLQANTQRLEQLGQWDAEAGDRLGQAQELLDSQFRNVLEQQGQQLQERLRNRLLEN